MIPLGPSGHGVPAAEATDLESGRSAGGANGCTFIHSLGEGERKCAVPDIARPQRVDSSHFAGRHMLQRGRRIGDQHALGTERDATPDPVAIRDLLQRNSGALPIRGTGVDIAQSGQRERQMARRIEQTACQRYGGVGIKHGG